ncbi:sensor histidine kinase [Lichenicoccus roseus]|nr:histidine kinase [Lichenicoccus roseus]
MIFCSCFSLKHLQKSNRLSSHTRDIVRWRSIARIGRGREGLPNVTVPDEVGIDVASRRSRQHHSRRMMTGTQPLAPVPRLGREYGPIRRATLQLVFWTAVGILFALPALSTGTAGRQTLWQSLAEWWAWGLLAPAITAANHALPFSSRQNGRRLCVHLLFAPLFTAIDVHVSALVSAVIGIGAWSTIWDPHLVAHSLQGGFVWGLLVYGLIAGIAEAGLARQRVLFTELRMERLQRNFSEARLHALRMQLDPHFLFNALNTISSQVTRDGRLARAMIEHLAELLRLSLDDRSRHEVCLDEELALLEHYLAIQRLRFGDRLRIIAVVDRAAAAAAVPSLLMQPLVENAIRHGIAPRIAGGTVEITARCTASRLEIRIRDDGVGYPLLPNGPREGVGLSVTRERIERFDTEGTGRMTIQRRPEGGTEVALSLPLRVRDRHDAAA